MNCISPVRFDIKIKFGSQEFSAAHVQVLGQATNKESEGFSYFRQKFPKISEINTKKAIFFGPRNEQLFEDQEFNTELNATEGRAWETFRSVCRNFLGKE
jgi:hypothetical protein